MSDFGEQSRGRNPLARDDASDQSERSDWIQSLMHDADPSRPWTGYGLADDLDERGISLFTVEEIDHVASYYGVDDDDGSELGRGPIYLLQGALSDARVREADEAARAVADGLERLSNLSESRNPIIRERATAGFALAQRHFRPAEPQVDGVQHPLFRWGRSIDNWLSGRRRGLARHGSFSPTPAVSRAWTFAGLVVTGIVAYCLASGNLGAAGLLMVLRQVLTVLLGGEGSLPLEQTAPRTHRDVVYRCVATHLADAVMLMGVAVAAYQAHSLLILLVALSALVAMLCGTLLRVAALQVGVQVNRLHLERVVRVLPGAFALIVSYFVPQAAPVALLIAAGGCLAYGVGEAVRSLVRISHDLRGKDRTLVLTTSDVTRESGSRMVAARERIIAAA